MTASKKRPGGARPVNGYDVASRIGNGDRGLEGGGLAVGLIAGHTMMLPERVRLTASDEQRVALGEAFELVREHLDVLADLDRAVARLRELGLSWETVGWVTGLTSAGARKRWGR